MGKREQALIDAGFIVTRTYKSGVWFEVIDPDGKEAAVLCQSESCWHWFSKAHRATASGSSAATCHKGGLGDAIDTDSRMRTYKRLLDQDNVPRPLVNFEGVYAAMCQVLQS